MITDRIDELADYSEQVRDVLTRPPSGLIRRGTGLVVLVVGLLVGTASWIRYPDTLTGPVVLTTTPHSQPVIVRINGRLGRIIAKDNQVVKKGYPLAEIENTTRLVNVSRLHQLKAAAYRFLRNPRVPLKNATDTTTFGDIQPEVNTLTVACRQYHRLVSDGYVSERLALLNREIKQYQQLIAVNSKQAQLNGLELENAEKKYRMDKRLFNEKVYSQAELLASENEYLRRKREAEEYQKVLIQNKLQLAAKEKEQLELQQQQTQQIRTTSDNIRQALQNIENLLQTWQQTYLLTAPAAGRLHYLQTLEELQAIRAGDSLFAIVPQHRPIVGMASLSAANRGKLQVGQKVIIRLTDYPFTEYGVLRGKVETIHQSSSRTRCRIAITLPNQLISSYHKKLAYRYEMPGTAEVITEDLSLLQRVLFGLRKLIAPDH
ncbi:HlyD family efflux transporter periplasmic adaptor subunit [Spirosoma montaniterrae]|uniref:Membrane fusion protein biotin-lipoyl like domain-containing protein n=1 Tax=Spirosoma montaniterrae TaxID=1178516 RepID=A0A1P9WWT3_9BACT|nr:HlyD family efflux transporter periplasmic adaptor subunit [Spirosoma montaniterrae]AQG79778.1 hypothetical protein AWR27_10845 [Spirosoma montaniterrae]